MNPPSDPNAFRPAAEQDADAATTGASESPYGWRQLRSAPWLIAMLLVVALASAGLLGSTLTMLLLIFVGLIFGIALNGFACWLTRQGPFSYRVCYLGVVTILLLCIFVGMFYLGSQVVQRIDEFTSQLQSAFESVNDQARQTAWLQQMLPEGQSLHSMLMSDDSSMLWSAVGGLRQMTWGITGMLVIFFVGLYFGFEPKLYRSGLVKLFSPERRESAEKLLDLIREGLLRWVVGRIASMTIVGITTTIGLALLGVPAAVTLGFLAALLTFIPNIGPILAAVPQALVALNVGSQTVLMVLALNVGLQTVESYMITPLIQRHEVALPPILTIAAQLTIGTIAGIVGVMAAAPLVVVAMVTVKMLWVHEHFGEPMPETFVNPAVDDG